MVSYIRELYTQPHSDVEMEDGHLGGENEGDTLQQTAEVMAAMITVLLQHGRLRCGQNPPQSP